MKQAVLIIIAVVAVMFSGAAAMALLADNDKTCAQWRPANYGNRYGNPDDSLRCVRWE